jgi:uncharacterized membrane protein
MKTLFRDRQPVYALLGLSSLFSVGLVLFRVEYYNLGLYFFFMLWNLFLAWIPYGCAQLLHLPQQKSKLTFSAFIILGVWLLFFPNAPYMITDLFHFRQRAEVPLWFDVVMMFSFAWNGLLLALLSLYEVQQYIATHLNRFFGWVTVATACLLSGFGVYLGRYLRWNSWDIVSNPKGLFWDITSRFIHPSAHPRTMGVTLLFGCFMLVSYLSFVVLMRYASLSAIKTLSHQNIA